MRDEPKGVMPSGFFPTYTGNLAAATAIEPSPKKWGGRKPGAKNKPKLAEQAIVMTPAQITESVTAVKEMLREPMTLPAVQEEAMQLLAEGVDALPAIQRQEGGAHYKNMAIQPVEYIYANGIGYMEGSVIKYVSRWKAKNGVEDLKKARHFIDLLIELEGPKQ